MKKSAYKILALCAIAFSLLALLLGIIGGVSMCGSTDYYYKYDLRVPIPHTFEGSLAISGACILVLAIVFAALAEFAKSNKSYFFYCGSIAVCVISAILLFYGSFEYFSYDGAVFGFRTIHINYTYFNLTLTSAIFSVMACILSIVDFCIGNFNAKAEKAETSTSKNVQSVAPVAASNNVYVEQNLTSTAASTAPIVQAPVSEPIRSAVQSAPQFVAVAPTPAKVPILSLEDGLTQLGCFNDLYKAGILTQEEFSQQKRRIFEDMGIDFD